MEWYWTVLVVALLLVLVYYLVDRFCDLTFELWCGRDKYSDLTPPPPFFEHTHTQFTDAVYDPYLHEEWPGKNDPRS